MRYVESHRAIVSRSRTLKLFPRAEMAPRSLYDRLRLILKWSRHLLVHHSASESWGLVLKSSTAVDRMTLAAEKQLCFFPTTFAVISRSRFNSSGYLCNKDFSFMIVVSLCHTLSFSTTTSYYSLFTLHLRTSSSTKKVTWSHQFAVLCEMVDPYIRISRS